MREYDQIAAWYAAQRGTEMGVPEVAALAASLPKGARVLDAGCGTGLPLTRVLIDRGCSVLAVDSSGSMLEHFRRGFPDVPAICASIQACELEPEGFDAALAWGVLFHLPHDEQRQAVANISRALKPGGPFLFTAGNEHGSIDGAPMNGVPFRYHSFSVVGYRDLLREHALSLEETHADAGGNTYYLARKTSRSTHRASAAARRPEPGSSSGTPPRGPEPRPPCRRRRPPA